MAWKFIVIGLVICAAVATCTITRMEQLSSPSKLTRMEEAAMIQARWEASARARQEVER